MILKEQKVPAIVTVYFSLGSAFGKKITEGYKDVFVNSCNLKEEILC